ncbi:glycosyltransferase [Treponema sp. J25]|uniref:glycosyltransferase family 32 protein n=1 Tax=Treponema sp. J25 TaxID=2094121 RepID=UPI00104ACAB8|nr:glycosyltransferase [Treponema sp. J25]TCW60735.1 hypothetical protein C5O22_09705 [Treponema sp. J25]
MNKFLDLCLFETEEQKKLENLPVWELAERRFNDFLNQSLPITQRIPRIIHQIWLGSPVPEAYKTFMQSWKLYHPDWEYILWDEEKIKKLGLKNKIAYNLSPSYGIKSDIARYEILYRFGGIYVDTDFECLKNFEPIIEGCGFFAGHSNGSTINIINALIGTYPQNFFFEELLEATKRPLFSTDGMKVINHSGPGLFTELFIKNMAINLSAVIFPSLYFYPYPNYELSKNLDIKTIKKTYIGHESYAIHYWEASWIKNRWQKKIKSIVKKMLGIKS